MTTGAPLPPVSVRHLGKVAGFGLFVWSLVSCSVATVLFATVGLLLAPFAPSVVRRIPIVWARLFLRLTGVTVETTYDAPLPDGPVVFVYKAPAL